MTDALAVDLKAPCWLWTKSKDSHGYGVVSVRGRQIGAHRYMWIVMRGEIPSGKEIHHLCRVRHCVKDWDSGMFGPDPFPNPVCEFCNRRTLRFGRGGNGNFGSYACRGCGWSLETHDAGLTWKVTKLVGGQDPPQSKAVSSVE